MISRKGNRYPVRSNKKGCCDYSWVKLLACAFKLRAIYLVKDCYYYQSADGDKGFHLFWANPVWEKDNCDNENCEGGWCDLETQIKEWNFFLTIFFNWVEINKVFHDNYDW